MANKSYSVIKIIFIVLQKIFLIALFVPIVLCLTFFALFSFLIDLIAKKEDEQHLKYSEIRKRETDRKNARYHRYLEFIVNYIRAIFS